jgi:polygalacturonase
MSFDGYLKNFVFAYNYVSTGDDDMAFKGSQNPSPAGSGLPGIDGNRDVRSDRKYGMVVAHNHIYYGHGISVGSETNAGVTNIQVYDNSFNDSEEGLRIKSDYARGGEVSNVHYKNICVKNGQNALLFTPYYSTKALPAVGPLFPNFHDITMENVRIQGKTAVKLQGFQANTGGFGNPAYPLGMSMTNVVADSPDDITLTTSDAKLTIKGVNLPLIATPENRNVITGVPTKAVDPTKVVDCSKAYVDFPAIGASNFFGSTWDSRH